MFSNQYLIGSLLITACVIFHVMALLLLSSLLTRLSGLIDKYSENLKFLKKIVLLVVTVLFVIMIHTIEIIIWAITYRRLGEFEHLQEAIYFSTITATTLGYGDITLSEQHQLLSGFEAIGGLILFGLSTAFFLKFIGVFFDDIQTNRE